MQKAHLWSGMFVLFIFALTGLYMDTVLDLSNTDFDAQRMMYRASHIYLLWAGALNLLVGCYWSAASGRVLKWLQNFASSLLILAQVLLLAAFATEPKIIDEDRMLTFIACVVMLVGVSLTLVARFREAVFAKVLP